MVADLRDVLALAHLAEVPAAVGGVAVEAGTDQHVILDHQFLVYAADGVGEGDGLCAFAADEIAGREQVDAGNLELGRSHRAEIAGKAEHGQVVGADLGLFEQRSDQAIGGAAMIGTFADGVDARIVGLQGVVDQYAAVARQAGLLGQLAVGADAGGHHHQVSGNHLAIGEAYGLDAAFVIADQLGCLLWQQELQAAALQGALQQGASGLVQLALHQPVTDVHHGHIHPAQLEAIGRLQAEQAAADDHRVPVGLGGFHHHLGIGDVAVTDHSLKVVTGNGQDERIGAGGDKEAVIFGLAAVVGDDPATGAIDLHHLALEHQANAVLGIPVQVVEHDLFELLLAGQHGGEQDAVVVGMRLGAEHRDVVELVGQLEQLFEGSHAGHAVADHHQFEFLHARSPCHPVRRLACSNSFQQQKRRPTGSPVRTPLSVSRSVGKPAAPR